MIIVPANTLAAGGFEVANSCRFNSADSAELTKTFGSAGNQKTWTFSCWMKRSGISGSAAFSLIEAGYGSTPWFASTINNDTIAIGATAGSSASWSTAAVFRDVAAWYHIVLVVDTTQSTSSISNGSTDRIRVFVNNVQQTLSGGTVPSLNADLQWNGTAGQHMFGASYGQFQDCYVSEVAFIDGSALNPSSFAEYDDDSPTIWKPKDFKDDVTFGTNGYYLDFADSGDLGDDESGNTNDWTEANLAAADQATDTPTNNFCTMNPLDNEYVDATFSEGNNQVVIASGIKTYATSTMGVSAGKWYWEVELGASDGNDQSYGIADRVSTGASVDVYATGYPANYVYETQGRFIESETTNTDSCPDTYTAGDVMMFALDLDNDKIYYGKNGTWQCSGDPTSGATGTGAQSIKGTADADTSGFYFPICSSETTARGATWQFNFGGCSAFTVSSGNADGNGYGNFEYAPPSSFFSLCTKNLAEYG